MEKHEDIDSAVEATLDAFSETPRISASPNFVNRVMDRIQGTQTEPDLPFSFFHTMLTPRPVLLLLFVTLNILTAFHGFEISKRISRDGEIMSLADDYSLVDKPPPKGSL